VLVAILISGGVAARGLLVLLTLTSLIAKNKYHGMHLIIAFIAMVTTTVGETTFL
jgi:predicted membrane protein